MYSTLIVTGYNIVRISIPLKSIQRFSWQLGDLFYVCFYLYLGKKVYRLISSTLY